MNIRYPIYEGVYRILTFKDGWFVNPVLTTTGIPTIRKMSEDEYRASRNIPLSGLKQRMAQFQKRKDAPVSRSACLTSKKTIS